MNIAIYGDIISAAREKNIAHQNKHIREAIEYAKSQGWTYAEGGKSHKKGTLMCQHGHRGCMFFVYGTPRNPENTAKRIRREVDNCPGA